MARSPLTLAALATAAVPGLEVAAAHPIGSGAHGDFESALLTSADGQYFIIRVPTSERAEAEQSADLVALRALSTGVRKRLPFSMSSFVGQTPVGGTRAIVSEFVLGHKISLAQIPAGEGLAVSIGEAIAAIHSLPTTFIADTGLPVYSAHELLQQSLATLDRAASTGLVPAALLQRWEEATGDAALWQFAPTVINGALSADSMLVDGAGDGAIVVGILGWHALSVGDPARDLFWLLGSPREGVADTVLDAYLAIRGTSDRQLGRRARFYSELELARWLVHGTTVRDESIIEDAVSMLHSLVDRVQGDMNGGLTHHTMPVLAVDEVDAMLRARGA